MKIGVIGGTGGQGLGIAVRFAQAGEDVIIGSRTVDKAQAAADKVKAVLGDSVSVRGAENLDAAKEADILVLTVPLPAQKSTLLSIKEAAAGATAGRYRTPRGHHRWFAQYISSRRFRGTAIAGDPTGRQGDLCIQQHL